LLSYYILVQALALKGRKIMDYLTEAKRRFRKYVEINPLGCWIWVGALCKGYGIFYFDGRKYRAHKWLWELVNGPVFGDLELDHLCNNKACVNPAHLEPVTHAENSRRAAELGVWDGEKNSQAKRTEIEVYTIRLLNQYMYLPAPMIARTMGIPQRSVYSITRNEVWRHIEVPSNLLEEWRRQGETS
jgi:hypothetical protein